LTVFHCKRQNFDRSAGHGGRDEHIGGGEGYSGEQNVSRSARVKIDAASVCVSTNVAFAVLLAASVFTHVLRGTFCTPCTPFTLRYKFYFRWWDLRIK
jgi:hypothetical protein